MKEEVTKYEGLIAARLGGTITPEQERDLSEWLLAAPANRRKYEDYVLLWEAGSSEGISLEEQEKEADWNNIVARIEPNEYQGKVIRILPRWSYLAAAVLLLLLAVVFLLPKTGGMELIAVTAEDEIPMQVDLPDGSTVWLNEGAKLQYDRDFETREVLLEGEGFFSVVKSEGVSFTVLSGQSRTVVLGTRFSIENNSDGQVTLLVEEGRVGFSLESVAEELIINGSEGAIANVDQGMLERIASFDINRLAWKSGYLEFDGDPIDAVLKDIAKAYNVEFRVGNNAILNCHFRSKFDNADLSEILNTLEFSLGIEIEKEGEAYSIKGNGCE